MVWLFSDTLEVGFLAQLQRRATKPTCGRMPCGEARKLARSAAEPAFPWQPLGIQETEEATRGQALLADD